MVLAHALRTVHGSSTSLKAQLLIFHMALSEMPTPIDPDCSQAQITNHTAPW